MCGRYAVRKTDPEIANIYGAVLVGEQTVAPSYNVAPTQQVRIVIDRAPHSDHDGDITAGQEPPERQLRLARWGLVPFWSKSAGKAGGKMINARAETITEKPAYRAAAVKRRAIVPMSGYIEWMQETGGKQPYFLHDPDSPDDADGQLLSAAGLYELWADPDKADDDPTRFLWSALVITCQARDAAGTIHDRSPLILPPDMIDAWLDPTLTDPARVRDLVDQVPPPQLQPYPVARAINSVRNNRPDLLDPVHA